MFCKVRPNFSNDELPVLCPNRSNSCPNCPNCPVIDCADDNIPLNASCHSAVFGLALNRFLMFVPSLPNTVSLRSAVSLVCSSCWRRLWIYSTLSLSPISRLLANRSISASASAMVWRISLTVFLRIFSKSLAMAVPSFL